MVIAASLGEDEEARYISQRFLSVSAALLTRSIVNRIAANVHADSPEYDS